MSGSQLAQIQQYLSAFQTSLDNLNNIAPGVSSNVAIDPQISLQAAKTNLTAFSLGRAFVAGRLDAPEKPETADVPFDLDAFMAARVNDLTDYQNAAYAARYADLVGLARRAEAAIGGTAFAEAVARNAFKLMAYKDEYEVARLYMRPEFRQALAEQFENPDRISVFLAPPILGEKDAHGHPKKRKFGPWVFKLFDVLQRFKGLRGTVFDLFGYTTERRTERKLVADYFELIARLSAELTPEKRDVATALARLPEDIRGFGHVKAENLTKVDAHRTELLQQFDAPVFPDNATAGHQEPVKIHEDKVHV